MSLQEKTLLIAHAVDFNSVTFLPSKHENSADRPKNSFHFIDNSQPLELEISIILQEEAFSEGRAEIKKEKSIDGIDYFLATFSVKNICKVRDVA